MLYKQLFKSDNALVLAPVIVQSFDFNYALYKAETSLRMPTDTFKTVNGPLRSALGSEKKPQNGNVGALQYLGTVQ